MPITDITRYDTGQSPEELIAEVEADLPNPERNILTHNERELIQLACRLASALRFATRDRSRDRADAPVS